MRRKVTEFRPKTVKNIRQVIDNVMARPAGLEPATPCLEGSINLFYYRMLDIKRHRLATTISRYFKSLCPASAEFKFSPE